MDVAIWLPCIIINSFAVDLKLIGIIIDGVLGSHRLVQVLGVPLLGMD